MDAKERGLGGKKTDIELISAARSGDKDAFGLFYDRHKKRMLTYAYRMTGSLRIAEEITQDAFVKAYAGLSGYAERGKALNWLYTITGNLCRNYLRDSRHDPALLLDKGIRGGDGLTVKETLAHDSPGPAESAQRKEVDCFLQAAINALPRKFKEVIVLCDIQGLSYEDAAGILRCRVGSVGSRLSRARLTLAKILKARMK